MQSETQQYDITAGAKEQRQQSSWSDKMVSSPGAIAEPIVWSNYAKSCMCIESDFLYFPVDTLLECFCMSVLFEKFILKKKNLYIDLHEFCIYMHILQTYILNQNDMKAIFDLIYLQSLNFYPTTILSIV